MRIKLSKLKLIIEQVISEDEDPSPFVKRASMHPNKIAAKNSDYELREIAKSLYEIAKLFRAAKGVPDNELMAYTLEANERLDNLTSRMKSKPQYVYLRALMTDFEPLVKASGKFGKPAFLGKSKYAEDNLASAEKLVSQLKRFKKEVLSKQTLDLVGHESA
jgi:hypothetical protein